MHQFHNILFVSHGLGGEEDALRQALKLAYDNQASLTVLIVCPAFPTHLEEYKATYEHSLIEHTEQAVQTEKSALHLSKKKMSVKIELESGPAPDIRIIRYVLRYSFDLLIKQAETEQSQHGFKATDMALLRKCPCPLFIVRPLKHRENKVRIAVAIDPMDGEPAAQALSIQLLQASSTIAKHYSGRLDVISCWNFPQEEYLRDSVWIATPKKELDQMILNEKKAHEKALYEIVDHAQTLDDHQIHHLKGLPDEIIPTFIQNHAVDILVMGTVARTGISGFIIGNTAENILQKINCSLLALKPNGFVSPVKPY